MVSEYQLLDVEFYNIIEIVYKHFTTKNLKLMNVFFPSLYKDLILFTLESRLIAAY